MDGTKLAEKCWEKREKISVFIAELGFNKVLFPELELEENRNKKREKKKPHPASGDEKKKRERENGGGGGGASGGNWRGAWSKMAAGHGGYGIYYYHGHTCGEIPVKSLDHIKRICEGMTIYCQ